MTLQEHNGSVRVEEALLAGSISGLFASAFLSLSSIRCGPLLPASLILCSELYWR